MTDTAWIERLRAECARTSQRRVATRLRQMDGYPSETVLSQVLSGKYPGRTDRLRDLVEGVYLGFRVACPLLGAIGRDDCAAWQAKPFSIVNETNVQMWRACRSGCEHSRIEPEDER